MALSGRVSLQGASGAQAGVYHDHGGRGKLEGIGKRSRLVADVRGTGLLLGVELADPDGVTPGTDLARAVQAAALRNGLILEVGGRGDATLRFMPPLNVTAEQIDTAARMRAGEGIASSTRAAPPGTTSSCLRGGSRPSESRRV